MKDRNYALAGWFSIINAIVFAPLMIFSLYMWQSRSSIPAGNILGSIADLIVAGLFAYTFYMFKILLKERYEFNSANIWIMILIWVHILLAVTCILGKMIPGLENILAPVVTPAVIPIGIFHVILALVLLKLKEESPGHIKPFTITLLISGVCMILILTGLVWSTALVIFNLSSLISTIIAYVFLGIIFSRAKEGVEFV
ncbi:hypothetical protein ACFL4T_12050 [candidate division KSB1 bacterium]